MALVRGAVLDGAEFFLGLLLAVFTKLAITNFKVSTDRIHFSFCFKLSSKILIYLEKILRDVAPSNVLWFVLG